MKNEDVLQLLETAILSLGLTGITSESIVRPNVVYDAGDRELYFETYVAESAASLDTERGTLGRCVCGVVACVPRGEGTARLDAIVEKLLDLFSPIAQGRLTGFDAVANVWGSSGQTIKTRVYALGATRGESRVVDGRYKTTVLVNLEIWED